MKKEALGQVFSCTFFEIYENTFFHRAPLVAASEYHIKHKDMVQNQENLPGRKII